MAALPAIYGLAITFQLDLGCPVSTPFIRDSHSGRQLVDWVIWSGLETLVPGLAAWIWVCPPTPEPDGDPGSMRG